MPAESYQLHGTPVWECAAEGEPLRGDRDATGLIGAAWEHHSRLVAIPAARLGDDFFRLRTRIAGEVLQKFMTYGLRVAIVGDISRYVSASAALRDFVYECNRGTHIWFVADREELGRRLEREGQG